MIKSIIIDDEPKNNRILRGLLAEFCPMVQVAGEATGSETAIPLIIEKQPDLVFLDIEMPYGNAFDLLDKIMPVNFEIVFITAFDDYTLRAFKYSALDYLLKPVGIDELKAAVQKASERIESKSINQRLNNLIFNFQKQKTAIQKIALPSKEGLMFISLIDIIRFEAIGGYTYIFATEGEKIISSKTIREYEEMLPDDTFFRIHNSHIININFVRKYHKGRGGYMEMEDNALIEVAIRRKDELLLRFGLK